VIPVPFEEMAPQETLAQVNRRRYFVGTCSICAQKWWFFMSRDKRMNMRRRAAQVTAAVVLTAGLGMATAPSASAAWSSPPRCNGMDQVKYDFLGWMVWDNWSAKTYGGRIYYEYRFTYYSIANPGATFTWGGCWA
jgi:hypothetical protein